MRTIQTWEDPRNVLASDFLKPYWSLTRPDRDRAVWVMSRLTCTVLQAQHGVVGPRPISAFLGKRVLFRDQPGVTLFVETERPRRATPKSRMHA